MRRLTVITAFGLFLALPLWAQRGGAHGGGGGHASFGGGHSGGFSSHASFGGAHGFSGGARTFTHSRTFSQHSSRGPFLHNAFHGRFHTYGFRNNCYGYACRNYGYPLWGWGYYDPYWRWNDSSYDDDYNQNLAIANEMNQQSLEQQQMLRHEEADGDQDSYARHSSAPRPAADREQGTAILPPTILVFRDQHKQEVQNYAIVGQTLWNFAPQHTQKFPLSDLDLQATEKANDDRGVTFRIPSANEGQ